MPPPGDISSGVQIGGPIANPYRWGVKRDSNGRVIRDPVTGKDVPEDRPPGIGQHSDFSVDSDQALAKRYAPENVNSTTGITPKDAEHALAAQKHKIRIRGGTLTQDQIDTLSGLQKYRDAQTVRNPIKYAMGDGPMQTFQPESKPDDPYATINFSEAMKDYSDAKRSQYEQLGLKEHTEDRELRKQVATAPERMWQKTFDAGAQHRDYVTKRETEDLKHYPKQLELGDAQVEAATKGLQARSGRELDNFNNSLSDRDKNYAEVLKQEISQLRGRSDPMSKDEVTRLTGELGKIMHLPDSPGTRSALNPQVEPLEAANSLEAQSAASAVKRAIRSIPGGRVGLLHSMFGGETDRSGYKRVQEAVNAMHAAMVQHGADPDKASAYVMKFLDDNSSGLNNEEQDMVSLSRPGM